MRTDISTAPSGNADTHHRASGFDTRVRFDAGTCLSVRYPDLECGLCTPACPTGAIAINGSRPVLQGKCIGCGQCSAICPSAAMRVDGFALPSALLSATTPVEVDCWRVPLAESPPGAMRVPCLAGTGSGWLLALFELAGERPIHLLDRGGCADCAAGGTESIKTTLHEARLLLAESGVDEAQLPVRKQYFSGTQLLPAIPESSEAQAVDRRGFFRDLIGSVARGTDQIRVTGTPAHHVDTSRQRNVQPVERLRVVASLARIAARHARQVPARVVPQLSLSQCDAHGVCAVVCPTGALRQQAAGEEGTIELQFNSALCIACGQCARVCPDTALRLTPEGGTLADQVLARWSAHTCEDCGESFFGALSALCPDCIKKVNLQQSMAALFRPFA